MTPSKRDDDYMERSECKTKHSWVVRLIAIMITIIVSTGGFLFIGMTDNASTGAKLGRDVTHNHESIREIKQDMKDIKVTQSAIKDNTTKALILLQTRRKRTTRGGK